MSWAFKPVQWGDSDSSWAFSAPQSPSSDWAYSTGSSENGSCEHSSGSSWAFSTGENGNSSSHFSPTQDARGLAFSLDAQINWGEDPIINYGYAPTFFPNTFGSSGSASSVWSPVLWSSKGEGRGSSGGCSSPPLQLAPPPMAVPAGRQTYSGDATPLARPFGKRF
jgi:hypothetical protein